MPDCLARELIGGSEDKLTAMLERFLFALDNPAAPKLKEEAIEMIGGALKRSPKDDARVLHDLGRRAPEFTIALLSGRLRSARNFIPRRVLRRAEVERAIAIMLVYYGVLDLQLIAARARAAARFGFGVSSPSKEPAMGGLLGGWKDIIEAIEYAMKTANGPRPSGRTPRLIRLLHWKARNIRSNAALSDDEWLTALAPLLVELAEPLLAIGLPAIEEWRQTAETNLTAGERKALADGSPPPEQNKNRQPENARLSVSTAMHGIPVGEQLAFASLRLESLVRHAPALAAKKRISPANFDEFNNQPFVEGADGPSLSLYFVHQALIVENHNAAPGQSLYVSLDRYAANQHGSKSLTTIKDVRARKERYLRDRGVVSQSRDHPLTRPQAYDILPDYRLEVRATLPAKPSPRQRGKKGHDQSFTRKRHELTALFDFLYRPPSSKLPPIDLAGDPFGDP